MLLLLNPPLNSAGAINDLKFHTSKPNFLASASEDLSVRLWNIRNCSNVAVFHGELHSSQVLALDFHPTGDYIASCGMDHYIVIWSLNEAVKTAMKNSETHRQGDDFTTIVIDSQNAFKTDKIHNNYVDRWAYWYLLTLSISLNNIFNPQHNLAKRRLVDFKIKWWWHR